MEHPVRLTKKQVHFIDHITDEFNDFFEEEFRDLSSSFRKAEREEDLHPVRLTEKQVGFISHMLNEIALEYYDEEGTDLLSTIESAEKRR